MEIVLEYDLSLDVSQSDPEVYGNFIRGTRMRLHSEFLNPDETNEEMKVSLLSKQVNCFITVMLHFENMYRTFFHIRCLDVYLVGFAKFDQTSNKLCCYEFRNPNKTHIITHLTFLPYRENYHDMQRYAGIKLTELTVGHFQLQNLVFALHTSSYDDKVIVKNLLVICVMIPESIRFKGLFKSILACFDSGYQLSEYDIDLITSWSKMSKLLTVVGERSDVSVVFNKEAKSRISMCIDHMPLPSNNEGKGKNKAFPFDDDKKVRSKIGGRTREQGLPNFQDRIFKHRALDPMIKAPNKLFHT
ncbi:uncharacterized protein A4U43_C08F750 [Asparagus officinalis]|nr:uncharacterized protein A4U43_C08F750 [Asparagus officinalis]